MSDLPRPVETPAFFGAPETPIEQVVIERPLQYAEPAAPAAPARPEPFDYNPQGAGWREGYYPEERGYGADYGGGFDTLHDARLFGYSWDEINNFQAMQRGRAYEAGYTQEEIRDHLGFADWQNGDRRNDGSWQTTFSAVPALITGLTAPEPQVDLALSPGYRQDYAAAMLRGEVDGPRDFAYRYAASALQALDNAAPADDPDTVQRRLVAAGLAAENLATELPTVEDLTDAAVGIASQYPHEPARVRRALMDKWVADGEPPVQQAIRASTDPLTFALNVVAAPMDFSLGFVEALITEGTDIKAALEDATFVEAIGAAFGRVPRMFWEMARGNGKLVEAAAKGEPVSAEEAFWMAASMAHFSRFPGGAGPLQPDILPPLPRVELPPGPRPAPKEGPIIEGEFTTVGPKVKLPPLPDVPLIDFDLPPGAPPRMITAREAVVDPVPPPEIAAVKVAEELSLADKINRAEMLRQENEGFTPNQLEAGSFFQRKVAEMQARGELPEGSWAAKMEEPSPQRLAEMAEGFDNARTVAGWAQDTFGRLLADESGALRIFATPAEKAQLARTRSEKHAIKSLLKQEQTRGSREIANVVHALQPLQKYINAEMPSWQAELAKGPMGNPMGTPLGALINFIEGVGYGPVLRLDHPTTPVANVIAELNAWKHQMLTDAYQRGDINETGYRDNYFRHLWKDPAAATSFFDAYMGTGKQGSSATMKARTLPTFADGLRRGLAPAIEHPLDLVVYDIGATVKMIHAARIRKEMEATGLLAWRTKPEIGEVQLTGVGVQRSVPIQAPLSLRQAEAAARDQLAQAVAPFERRIKQLEADVAALQARGASKAAISYARQLVADERNVMRQTTKPMRDVVRMATEAAAPSAYMEFAYAPPHVAKIYNNWLSNGWGDTRGTGNSLADKFMWMKNTAVGLTLALPLFHTAVILGAIGSTSMMTGKGPLAIYRRGLKARDDYVKLVNDPILNQLVDAGLRVERPGVPYQFGPMKPYWESWAANNAGNTMRERLGNVASAAMREVVREINSIGGPPGERLLPHFKPTGGAGMGSAFWALPRTLKVPLDEVSRALTSLNAPLFNHFIPVVKAGAAMSMMEHWLRKNPTASPEMVQRRAQQIVLDVEYRFGEQNMDNIFVNNFLKFVASASTISVTWALSTWAWTAQALRVTGEWNPISTKSFINSLVLYHGINALLTLGHTGTLPNSYLDFVNFRTGTTLPGGAPQRGMWPSEFKEFHDMGKIVATTYGRGDPVYPIEGMFEYVMGKMNVNVSTIRTMVTGEDAIGRKPAYMPGGWPRWYLEQVTPMVLNNVMYPKKNTGLNTFETLFMREAPLWLSDPPAFYKQQEGLVNKWTAEGIRRAVRDNSKLENPKYDVSPSPSRSRSNRSSSGGKKPAKPGSAGWGR